MKNTIQSKEQNKPLKRHIKRWEWGVIVLAPCIALLYFIYTFTRHDKPAQPASTADSDNEARISFERIHKSTDAMDFTHRQNQYSAFIFNASKHLIEFYYQHTKKEKFLTLENLKEIARQKGDSLLFATNAGIFDTNYQSVGLFVSNGQELTPLNIQDGDGNFFLKPNGVFFIKEDGTLGILESEEFKDSSINVLYATQSGPLLLRNDQIHPAFNEGSHNQLVRSGVGVISQTEAVFLISRNPVNFYEFSRAFREKFNCRHALYLDGVISQAYFWGYLEKLEESQAFSGVIGVRNR